MQVSLLYIGTSRNRMQPVGKENSLIVKNLVSPQLRFIVSTFPIQPTQNNRMKKPASCHNQSRSNEYATSCVLKLLDPALRLPPVMCRTAMLTASQAILMQYRIVNVTTSAASLLTRTNQSFQVLDWHLRSIVLPSWRMLPITNWTWRKRLFIKLHCPIENNTEVSLDALRKTLAGEITMKHHDMCDCCYSVSPEDQHIYRCSTQGCKG